jgi:hypothetical protein
MNLIGLDLNATRMRAVRGPLGDSPHMVPLAPPLADLAMVLDLRNRSAQVGAAGLGICRQLPRQAWQNFLPQIAQSPPPRRKWFRSSSKLDAARALGMALQHAAGHCKHSDGVVLTLPAYLSDAQIGTVLTVAVQAGIPVLGSIAAPLAASLAAHAEQTWFGAAVVVDVDDQSLTVATVRSDQGQAKLLDACSWPHLNFRAWQERLLNALADCFILDSRWDPRESAVAEQTLFDQLDGLLDATLQGRAMQVSVRMPERFQNLVLQPHDSAVFCAALRRQAAAEVARILNAPREAAPIGTVLITADAARLPGLVADLQALVCHAETAIDAKTTLDDEEDFGQGLLDDEPEESKTAVVLTTDAAARGAHSVAVYFQRGDVPCGHFNAAAPLPLPRMRTTA